MVTKNVGFNLFKLLHIYNTVFSTTYFTRAALRIPAVFFQPHIYDFAGSFVCTKIITALFRGAFNGCTPATDC